MLSAVAGPINPPQENNPIPMTQRHITKKHYTIQENDDAKSLQKRIGLNPKRHQEIEKIQDVDIFKPGQRLTLKYNAKNELKEIKTQLKNGKSIIIQIPNQGKITYHYQAKPKRKNITPNLKTNIQLSKETPKEVLKDVLANELVNHPKVHAKKEALILAEKAVEVLQEDTKPTYNLVESLEEEVVSNLPEATNKNEKPSEKENTNTLETNQENENNTTVPPSLYVTPSVTGETLEALEKPVEETMIEETPISETQEVGETPIEKTQEIEETEITETENNTTQEEPPLVEEEPLVTPKNTETNTVDYYELGQSNPQNEGLHPHVAEYKERVADMYDVEHFSLYRHGDTSGEHGKGLAVDFMTYQDEAKGDAIADYSVNQMKNGEDHIYYVIWKQRISGAWTNYEWEMMEDRGSITQNHYDHVHVSFDPVN